MARAKKAARVSEPKPAVSLAEAMFSFSLIALAMYRTDEPGRYMPAFEEAAKDLEDALASQNVAVRRMLGLE